jgi:hypothetical protein
MILYENHEKIVIFIWLLHSRFFRIAQPKNNHTLQSTTYIVYMSKNYYTYNVSDMHTMYIMQAKSEDNKVIDKSNMNPRAGPGTKLANIGTRKLQAV